MNIIWVSTSYCSMDSEIFWRVTAKMRTGLQCQDESMREPEAPRKGALPLTTTTSTGIHWKKRIISRSFTLSFSLSLGPPHIKPPLPIYVASLPFFRDISWHQHVSAHVCHAWNLTPPPPLISFPSPPLFPCTLGPPDSLARTTIYSPTIHRVSFYQLTIHFLLMPVSPLRTPIVFPVRRYR